MNKKQPISTSLIIVTISTIGTLLIGSNYFAYAEEAIWRDYGSMKKLVQAIEDGKVDDNNIQWKKFRTSNIYQDADKNTQKCIKFAHKIGDNIGDNEIVHCFKNENYFKDKYSNGNNNNNSTNIKSANSISNTTSSDTNATSSDTNATSSDTNATSSDTNATSSDTNATSSDTNATSIS
jgi:hypothetical protein